MVIKPKEVIDLFPILDCEGSLELLDNDKILFQEIAKMLTDLLHDVYQEIQLALKKKRYKKLYIKLEQLNETVLYVKAPHLRRVLSKLLHGDKKSGQINVFHELEYEIIEALQAIKNLEL